jgi:hypothetical protein
MVYQVHAGSVVAWYASFRKTAGWVLHLTKGIPRDAVESLMEMTAELGAESGVSERPPSVA